MVSEDAGVSAAVPDVASLFSEAPGRAVVETTDPVALREAVDAPVVDLGKTTTASTLSLSIDDELVVRDVDAIRERRRVLERELD
jgi:hypothetical protein